MDNTRLGTYLWPWLILLALLGVNMAVALLDLGLGPWANLAIAAIQALLVLSIFMYLRGGSHLLRLVAAAGFFWLMLLFGLVQSDYVTRFEDRAIGRLAPLKKASREISQSSNEGKTRYSGFSS